MRREGVCAVVVTYYPGDDLAANLAAISPQVQALVIVDNGSPRTVVEGLRSLRAGLAFNLVENPENLGIAAALNQGARWARDHGYEWIAFFDQDSQVTDGYIRAMTGEMAKASLCCSVHDRPVMLVPQYIDSRRGHRLPPFYAPDGNIALAMTSGSFLETAVLEQHGWFVDGLFIGAVDYEYSLRLRARGKVIKECRAATLRHAPSAPKAFRVAGATLFHTANYPPLRRYYAERNRVWLLRHYGARFPAVMARLYVGAAKDTLKLILGETDKWKKVSYMAQGVIDGLRGRMGKKRGT